MTGRTRVVIADDHPIVVSGLSGLIRTDNELELVGTAFNGSAALELILETRPDIAIIDISMPRLNGISLTKRLAVECPLVRVIALTVHEDRTYVSQAFQAGVRGYVLKRSLAEHLINAIRAVVRHETYVDPAVAGLVIGSRDPAGEKSNRTEPPTLTQRETEVLKLIALGQSNKEIAERLQVSIKSVETFKARGTRKLGLRTRADIVRFAAMHGWSAEL